METFHGVQLPNATKWEERFVQPKVESFAVCSVQSLARKKEKKTSTVTALDLEECVSLTKANRVGDDASNRATDGNAEAARAGNGEEVRGAAPSA